MTRKLPFSLTTRPDSPFYYVRLRNEETGKFLSWVSTKETNYNRALRAAWEIYNNSAKSDKLKKLSFYDTIKKSKYTEEDVEFFLEDFKRKGFIVSYVKNDNSEASKDALQWLLDFWNPEKSDYLKEKSRKGQTVHKKHTLNSAAFIKKYWTDILQSKKLGEISRNDIQKQFNKLDDLELNGNTKNHIIRAVLTPIKWAFNNELLQKDISRGWSMYKVEYKKRQILTMAMAQSVFKVCWGSYEAKLASMLSMCTGMRCGEIQALTLADLGENCIYVNHSWNMKDGLKSTKNGESRTVFIPFKSLMNELIALANRNPFKENGMGFIFWGKTPDKPIDCNVFRKYFRRALVEAGMDENDAKNFSFHSWRHFYTTYMIDRVNSKALQSQTGHKSKIMLEHYANHQTLEDQRIITKAQENIFGAMIENTY